MKAIDFQGQKIAVVGLGISNLALIDFLESHGADNIIACDRKPWEKLEPSVRKLAERGIKLQLAEEYLKGLDECDLIFLTPGMRRDWPELEQAKAKGVRLSSEIALFMSLCPAPIVGITGSSGKTTTTTLVGKILGQNRKVYVGGNIGQPLIGQLGTIKADELVVLELSSFQLQDLKQSPQIASILNITPNHLDLHKSMAEYCEAKNNIVRFQSSDNWAVLNKDNSHSWNARLNAKGKVVPFSIQEELDQGAFLRSGSLIWRFAGEEAQVCSTSEMKLLGIHNVSNALAATALSCLAGATVSAASSVLTTFTGVEHRLELVRSIGGVKYYNDSIATTPARTQAALAALKAPVHLIAGGYDKNLPFEELALFICKESSVKTVYTIGTTAEKIERAIAQVPGEKPKVQRCENMQDAVLKAAAAAKTGELVLLSPACASYDMFPNFQVRGQVFKELVEGLEA
ncbi:MAG: UDP-N-acetylmuramoyl-L-alanine--D-glutamate ligase [Firmicutes bacterium]|jgi:UDP-N-acetylmuramoylalanine--D-glutamate ligase|nr:UDP-N-acetylmuramoyl-L-alanine--D-glutamate ligase [Bacillota bacterium]HQD39949.1 UDP-N-acetylmuramoyl-L-alanine--D-glutamate ligase [Bacillota bacterium]